MNQGKIWTVVDPSVGLPVMLAAAAVTALLIHLAVLNNTTWFPAFMQGGTKKAAAVEHMQAPLAALPSNVSIN